MPKKELLESYARLAVFGANPKKGQLLVVRAPAEAYEFVRSVVKQAYKMGAGKVEVKWSDDVLTRLDYENVATDVLKEVPAWSIERTKWEIEKGACMLLIESDDPELLKGIDQDKIKEVRMARMKASAPFQYYTMNNIGQWSIIAYPNEKWAQKVFPDLEPKEAYEKLWDAILYTSRVFEGQDVIKTWQEHNEEIHHHADLLNDFNFKSLHFKNKYGTDLVVGLVKDHVWCGGDESTPDGQIFNANIPTEEVFTMPDCNNINGTVVSTKPLSYNGQLIKKFTLEFKDGKVIRAQSDDNQAVLDQILATDEGCKSLGEVALISYESPISKLDVLFYDTLFDENASCHLALGACYPTTLKGGENLSEDELYARGGNKSLNHVDFMFGSEDLSVVGLTQDGKEIAVFKDGNFCI